MNRTLPSPSPPAPAPASPRALPLHPAPRAALRVLIIEDNPSDVALIRGMLFGSGETRFRVGGAGSLAEARGELRRGRWDCILSDLGLPDSSGVETARRVREAAPGTPVVVLTALDERETALRAVAEGAQDFLVKGRVERDLLVRSIRYAIERHRLLAEVSGKYRQEVELAGLKSRLASVVGHELSNALNAIQCGVLLLDHPRRRRRPPEEREVLDIVRRNVRALGAIAKELLRMGRLESGRFTPRLRRTEVGALLQGCLGGLWALFQRRYLKISLALGRRPVAARADPEALALVVSNMLAAAAKSAPEGGRMAVALSASAGRARVRLRLSWRGLAPGPRREGDRALSRGSAASEALGAADRALSRGSAASEALGAADRALSRGSAASEALGAAEPPEEAPLAFLKTVLEAQGGGMTLREGRGGSRLAFTLPLCPPTAA